MCFDLWFQFRLCSVPPVACTSPQSLCVLKFIKNGTHSQMSLIKDVYCHPWHCIRHFVDFRLFECLNVICLSRHKTESKDLLTVNWMLRCHFCLFDLDERMVG